MQFCKIVQTGTFPNSEFAPVHQEMVQLRPRNKAQPKISESGQEAYGDLDESTSYCLHFITHRLLSEPKMCNRSRVVVVGGSDTGVAYLESLIMVPYLHFTNVTLLAPGGDPVQNAEYKPSSQSALMCGSDGVARFRALTSSYGSDSMQKMALGTRVNILTGEGARMIDLDRENKVKKDKNKNKNHSVSSHLNFLSPASTSSRRRHPYHPRSSCHTSLYPL